MILEERAALANGVRIPRLGLGTWMIPDTEVAEAVRHAVRTGYRHIDTAQAYRNEKGVGEGVRTCGVNREELFVTTKVAAEYKTYESAARSVEESLRTAGLEYFDMVIIHAPQPWAEFRGAKRYFAENRAVWKALEDAYAAGKVRAIGVSNFLEDDLENLLGDCRTAPMVNQILLHIGETPEGLIDFNRRHNVLTEAYSPIAHGAALRNAEVRGTAERYGVSVAQLCIRYTLQLGAVSLPKSGNPEHIESNVKVDFEIAEDDMLRLARIGQDYGDDGRYPVFGKKTQV